MFFLLSGDVPAEFEHADHKGDDGEEKEQEDEDLSGREVCLIAGLNTLAPIVVDFMHRTAFGHGFDSVGVP